MTITQLDSGLRPGIAKGGCEFLCYLWCGWLWAKRDEIGLPQITVEDINLAYLCLLRKGAIAANCRVHNVIDVVRHFPGSLGVYPTISIDRVAPMVRICTPFDVGADMRDTDQFMVYVSWWKAGAAHRAEGGIGHWTAVCYAPYAYYDPFVSSVSYSWLYRVHAVRILCV